MATMPDLRPLGFGEILDVGIKLYLRHWRPLMLCTVGLILPVQIISVLVLLSVAPEALDPTTTEPVDPDDANTFLAATVVTSVLTGIVYVVASVACFKAVADGYLGAQPSARRSLAFAVRALPRLLLLALIFIVAFVAVVAVIAGIAAVLLPVGVILGIAGFVAYIWLAVSFSLTIPAMLFERTMPWTALGRSFRLVKGRWWSVCGIIVVGIMLVSFLAGLLQGVIQVVPAVLADGNDAVLAFSTVVGQTVGYTLTTPFTAAVLALLYFDQRVRKEGFDLQLLAQGMGQTYEPGAIPPPVMVEPQVTPEQRAAAPFWPPPPGWKPPETAPTSTGGWAHPASAPSETPPRDEAREDAPARDDEPPPRDQPPPRDEPPPRDQPPPQDEAPPADRPPQPWEPPRSPSWPPEPPERGPGGL